MNKPPVTSLRDQEQQLDAYLIKELQTQLEATQHALVRCRVRCERAEKKLAEMQRERDRKGGTL